MKIASPNVEKLQEGTYVIRFNGGEIFVPDDRHMLMLAAYIMGSVGGKIGGPARAKSLTPERRAEISRNAANARWNKAKGQS